MDNCSVFVASSQCRQTRRNANPPLLSSTCFPFSLFTPLLLFITCQSLFTANSLSPSLGFFSPPMCIILFQEWRGLLQIGTAGARIPVRPTTNGAVHRPALGASAERARTAIKISL